MSRPSLEFRSRWYAMCLLKSGEVVDFVSHCVVLSEA